jgi:hypothetical protein
VWIRDVEAETGIDARTATSQVQNGLLEVRYVGADLVRTEETLARTFYEAGQIGRPVAVHGIVDNLLPRGFRAN